MSSGSAASWACSDRWNSSSPLPSSGCAWPSSSPRARCGIASPGTAPSSCSASSSIAAWRFAWARLTCAKLGALTPTPLPAGEGLGTARIFPLSPRERGTEGVREPRSGLPNKLQARQHEWERRRSERGDWLITPRPRPPTARPPARRSGCVTVGRGVDAGGRFAPEVLHEIILVEHELVVEEIPLDVPSPEDLLAPEDHLHVFLVLLLLELTHLLL